MFTEVGEAGLQRLAVIYVLLLGKALRLYDWLPYEK